jgi:hypothetical protein
MNRELKNIVMIIEINSQLNKKTTMEKSPSEFHIDFNFL